MTTLPIHLRKIVEFLVAFTLGAASCGVQAQSTVVIQDDFRNATSTQQWNTYSGACLTAGSLTQTQANSQLNIPACAGLPYYTGVTLKGGTTGTLPDAAGSGALRLTNNTNNERGGIISNFTFPSGSGVAVTFATTTYGGTGADGMTFYMMDGSVAPNIGAIGGSLGYSCSNINSTTDPVTGNLVGFDGVVGAYVGLGMDEYGNFLNAGDNTATGAGFQGGRIGLRGAGNIAWSWLSQQYGSYVSWNKPYYPSTLSANAKMAAVQATCASGTLWNYQNSSNPTNTGIPVLDYTMIPNGYTVLPSSTPIYNGSAKTRGAATPIVYQLNITQDGLLSLQYSYNGGAYQPVLTKQSITSSNGTLPPTLRFGFTGSTGGSNNIHEISCFRAEPTTQADSSAGINTQQTGQVRTGTQVYLAYFHRNNWSGQLTSQNLLYDPASQNVSISPTANWDASCVLTGGNCATTGVTGMTAQSPGSRSILTWSGTAGTSFEWSSLSTAQQNALTAGGTSNSNRLNYLRGDRTNEVNTLGAGLYRARASVLGDIFDSSPTWVGPPSTGYADGWIDRTSATASLPENGATAQKYSAFVTAGASRTNVVYVGANDGLLHGFRSGAYDSSGNYVSTGPNPNDGSEVLAYMPAAIVQTIHNASNAGLDYSSTNYGHAFSVDGTPSPGDLFYKGAWHTWLAAGLGVGGNSVYVLDITDPSRFSESNASSLVIGEWSPTTINCANVTNCGQNMGNTLGQPQIRRFHNGMWGFVFGNGFSSATGKAGIYVVTVDPTSAATTVYYLDTGVGSISSPNGIAFVTPADLDGDHIADYVYAGDLNGNIWRFDLTSASPSNWAASKYGNTVATPLFTTPSGQPITTQVTVPIVATTGAAGRVLVDFGTGHQTPLTISSPTTYATGSQYLYGIWDWDMASWNSKTSGRAMVSQTGPKTIAFSQLASQTVTGTYIDSTNQTAGFRTVSRNSVCWSGTSTCGSGNTQYGWQLALPLTQEQLVYSPRLVDGALLVNTTVPANASPLAARAPWIPGGRWR